MQRREGGYIGHRMRKMELPGRRRREGPHGCSWWIGVKEVDAGIGRDDQQRRPLKGASGTRRRRRSESHREEHYFTSQIILWWEETGNTMPASETGADVAIKSDIYSDILKIMNE